MPCEAEAIISAVFYFLTQKPCRLHRHFKCNDFGEAHIHSSVVFTWGTLRELSKFFLLLEIWIIKVEVTEVTFAFPAMWQWSTQ